MSHTVKIASIHMLGDDKHSATFSLTKDSLAMPSNAVLHLPGNKPLLIKALPSGEYLGERRQDASFDVRQELRQVLDRQQLLCVVSPFYSEASSSPRATKAPDVVVEEVTGGFVNVHFPNGVRGHKQQSFALSVANLHLALTEFYARCEAAKAYQLVTTEEPTAQTA